jgi:putative endonuclease
LLRSGAAIFVVIPGRREAASPESITSSGAIVYYVSILASRKHGTLYIGVTDDLVRRIYEHKTDAVRGFTSRYGVHLLVWFESYDDVVNAIEREKELKKWRREWKINLIESSNPNWVDLFESLAS